MTTDREVERLMDLVGALVQANVAQVQHCTKHKAFSEELGTQQRAAYIAVQDELERLVADARRMEFLHDKCSVSFMFRRTDGTNAMKLREPLNFDQLQRVMSQHFGARELTDDEADSAESFARAIERAHGIGA